MKSCIHTAPPTSAAPPKPITMHADRRFARTSEGSRPSTAPRPVIMTAARRSGGRSCWSARRSGALLLLGERDLDLDITRRDLAEAPRAAGAKGVIGARKAPGSVMYGDGELIRCAAAVQRDRAGEAAGRGDRQGHVAAELGVLEHRIATAGALGLTDRTSPAIGARIVRRSSSACDWSRRRCWPQSPGGSRGR